MGTPGTQTSNLATAAQLKGARPGDRRLASQYSLDVCAPSAEMLMLRQLRKHFQCCFYHLSNKMLLESVFWKQNVFPNYASRKIYGLFQASISISPKGCPLLEQSTSWKQFSITSSTHTMSNPDPLR